MASHNHTLALSAELAQVLAERTFPSLDYDCARNMMVSCKALLRECKSVVPLALLHCNLGYAGGNIMFKGLTTCQENQILAAIDYIRAQEALASTSERNLWLTYMTLAEVSLRCKAPHSFSRALEHALDVSNIHVSNIRMTNSQRYQYFCDWFRQEWTRLFASYSTSREAGHKMLKTFAKTHLFNVEYATMLLDEFIKENNSLLLDVLLEIEPALVPYKLLKKISKDDGDLEIDTKVPLVNAALELGHDACVRVLLDRGAPFPVAEKTTTIRYNVVDVDWYSYTSELASAHKLFKSRCSTSIKKVLIRRLPWKDVCAGLQHCDDPGKAFRNLIDPQLLKTRSQEEIRMLMDNACSCFSGSTARLCVRRLLIYVEPESDDVWNKWKPSNCILESILFRATASQRHRMLVALTPRYYVAYESLRIILRRSILQLPSSSSSLTSDTRSNATLVTKIKSAVQSATAWLADAGFDEGIFQKCMLNLMKSGDFIGARDSMILATADMYPMTIWDVTKYSVCERSVSEVVVENILDRRHPRFEPHRIIELSILAGQRSHRLFEKVMRMMNSRSWNLERLIDVSHGLGKSSHVVEREVHVTLMNYVRNAKIPT